MEVKFLSMKLFREENFFPVGWAEMLEKSLILSYMNSHILAGLQVWPNLYVLSLIMSYEWVK